MKQSINIQDQFLNQLRKENTFVTLYLLNGFQLRGLIKGFDNFTVLLKQKVSNSLFINMQFLHLYHKKMFQLN